MAEFSKLHLYMLLVLPPIVMVAFRFRDSRERDSDRRPTFRRYNSYVIHYYLPVMMLVYIPALIFIKDSQRKLETFAMLIGLFLHITVYYVLLHLLIPVLRRYISSRACAALWLLPNVFYITTYLSVGLPYPHLTIYIPKALLSLLLKLWLAGIAAVLVWKFAGHFRFRDLVLKDAVEITDGWIIDLWEDELRRAGHNGWLMLVRSPAVTTPLSIGFFPGTIRVILPERDYTLEELHLILRHELVHIEREDAVTKLMLTLCAAMCWFNPIMWWAMDKSAEDMELSCDETVLLDADNDDRRRYAELLLRTAGDGRGFTTCLSASAKALRYRLHRVVHPGKRLNGGLVAGFVTAVLLLTSGSVALAYDRGTGKELVFSDRPHTEFSLSGEAKWLAPDGNYSLEVLDPAAMGEYLSQLTCEKITDKYDVFQNYDPEYRLTLNYDGPDGSVTVHLLEHTMTVSVPGSREEYFVPDRINWLYLESLLETHA